MRMEGEKGMKYGIYFAYWETMWGCDQKKYIERVRRLGFDILEISCTALKNISKKEMDAFRQEAEAQGITLTAGYGPDVSENLGSADESVTRHAIEFYTDLLKKLEYMNIHTIGGGIYSYWPVDYSKPIDKAGDWARSVKNVRTVSRIACECGVEYCLEALNRFEGYLINTAAEAVQFVKEVDQPAVKVMLDTFHMNIEEDSMTDAILTAGSLLGHFHVGENNRRVPGKGNMPWSEIGQALRRIGYHKNVVMEPFVQSGGEVGRDIRIWRDLSNGASGELLNEDAKNSAAYLRHVFSGPASDYM